MSLANHLPKFRANEVVDSYEARRAQGDEALGFGLTYLDDALGGVLRDDFVVLGAYSGAGKTEMAVSIAAKNALKGKKVFFYALEAGINEIENRLLYRLAAEGYFKDLKARIATKAKNHVDFLNWKLGRLPEIEIYTIKAEKILLEETKNLWTFYKEEDFTVESLVQQFASFEIGDGDIPRPDMIIIDHAHYFDWGDQKEYDGLKKIVTTARTLNLQYQIPVVLVSHLRKSDTRNRLWAPTIEDFHGSSELYKQATKAITLGAGDKADKDNLIETFINCVKCRDRGGVTRYTARVKFDLSTNEYKQEYEIGEANQKRDKEFEPLKQGDGPGWATFAQYARDSVESLLPRKTRVPYATSSERDDEED